jgi:hypothetical protein
VWAQRAGMLGAVLACALALAAVGGAGGREPGQGSRASAAGQAEAAESAAREVQTPERTQVCAAPASEWTAADSGGPEGESVRACLRRMGRGKTDRRVPVDQRYELTTFGGPGDLQPVDCGDPRGADGTWYYAANMQRFACGQKVRLVDAKRRRCVVVQVADTGPHICVEEASGRPTWDVSPLAARELYGVTRAGWSDGLGVYAAPVAESTPLGPCTALVAARAEAGEAAGGGGVGSACAAAGECSYAGAVCLGASEGWPSGYCSAPCGGECPASAGPHALAVCAAAEAGAAPQCLAQCDFTLFESGCREGYCCGSAPGSDARVCLPAS